MKKTANLLKISYFFYCYVFVGNYTAVYILQLYCTYSDSTVLSQHAGYNLHLSVLWGIVYFRMA